MNIKQLSSASASTVASVSFRSSALVGKKTPKPKCPVKDGKGRPRLPRDELGNCIHPVRESIPGAKKPGRPQMKRENGKIVYDETQKKSGYKHHIRAVPKPIVGFRKPITEGDLLNTLAIMASDDPDAGKDLMDTVMMDRCLVYLKKAKPGKLQALKRKLWVLKEKQREKVAKNARFAEMDVLTEEINQMEQELAGVH